MNKLKEMFRGFKYRNFRLFFPGLAVSQIGIWIQNIAISYLVYDLTKSPFVMGVVMFFNAFPLFFVTPFAGVIADKFDRHKLLMTVQILYALQALLITLFTYFGLIRIWNIVLLGMFLNFIASIDGPLRQSTFVHLVEDKRDLGNAISLNSSCFNLARLLGPAIGGVIIAYYGTGMCFLINFICLVPIVVLVKMMKIEDKKDEKIKNETLLEGLSEGFMYCVKTPQILTLMVYLAAFCFLIMIYPMLMPIYTADVLKEKADVLGYILGATGVGSLMSSLWLATKTSVRGLRTTMFFGMCLACFCFILVGFSKSELLTALLMFGAGFGLTTFLTPENMLLQSVIDDTKRGRVMSFNSLCFLGTTSLSSLFAGTVAHLTGISNTFIILGILMLLIGFFLSYKLSKLDFYG